MDLPAALAHDTRRERRFGHTNGQRQRDNGGDDQKNQEDGDFAGRRSRRQDRQHAQHTENANNYQRRPGGAAANLAHLGVGQPPLAIVLQIPTGKAKHLLECRFIGRVHDQHFRRGQRDPQ